jgi:L-cysteine:1D-myo-inositol 2-amino-2-deoxy-alpha-D-glucopyranoside ligase
MTTRLADMDAWPAPRLSSVIRDRIGPAPELALYDARIDTVAATTPGDQARIYVCGITPYDATHMGHAATYVAFDLIIRAWREAGHSVRYVQNVTDVDDPLLERARETGEDWRALAEREIQLFRDDMTALAVIPPDVYAGAVETIPLVVDLVRRLKDKGAVYPVDGDLYYAVHSDPAFGSVSGLDREAMLGVFAERGGDPDRPGKRDPLDCLLWQQERPGEPAWDSELGRGRPGWHVECAAIVLHYLGAGIDIEGGGSDLAFPHHEMSAGEAQVVEDGRPFAKAYTHTGMVALDGHKMSKSLGNLVLVSRLRDEGVDPRAVRLTLLAQHYRSGWEWTDDLLATGEERLKRWAEAVATGGPDPTATIDLVRASLADDLDSPRALSAVDAWAESDGPPVEGAGDLVAGLIESSLGVSL